MLPAASFAWQNVELGGGRSYESYHGGNSGGRSLYSGNWNSGRQVSYNYRGGGRDYGYRDSYRGGYHHERGYRPIYNRQANGGGFYNGGWKPGPERHPTQHYSGERYPTRHYSYDRHHVGHPTHKQGQAYTNENRYYYRVGYRDGGSPYPFNFYRKGVDYRTGYTGAYGRDNHDHQRNWEAYLKRLNRQAIADAKERARSGDDDAPLCGNWDRADGACRNMRSTAKWQPWMAMYE